MQVSEIVNKVKDSLEQWGVSARVVVKGKDTLEIRIVASDPFTEQFSIKPAEGSKRPVVKTHATARPVSDTPRTKPKKERPNGFNLHMTQHKDSMSIDDLNRLLGLTKGYPFLSATRAESKVWETTCREVVWLSAGLFVDSHKWDKKWLSKTEAKGGGPAIVRGRFKDIPSVLDAIENCLNYIAEAHNNGGYWYPPLENGKIPRKSLASFLCTQTKSGAEWSPFCEVLWEMNKDAAIKSALPKLAVSAAEMVIKESQYLKSQPPAAMAVYWSGVKKFVDWYFVNRDVLLSEVNNRVRLADIGMAVTLVKEWNASASGRALPLSFIYPGADKWFRFTQWCKTNRNVSIPDYRQG